jgi:hypothetical protein
VNSVEYAWVSLWMMDDQEYAQPIRVRVIARRGRWAWVQHNAREPFTVLSVALTPDEDGDV